MPNKHKFDFWVDMGHRVHQKGSKCNSIHGHRYLIEAICEEGFVDTVEQGKDAYFDLIRTELIATVNYLCSHGNVLWEKDELLDSIYPEVKGMCFQTDNLFDNPAPYYLLGDCKVIPQGYCKAGKLVIVPFVPTVENLAKWWFNIFAPIVSKLANSNARLLTVKVVQAPNCFATYPGEVE